MRVLVTGAAGYIGSIVTEQLINSGYEVIAIDNLRHGHRSAVHPEAIFIQQDLCDSTWMPTFLTENPVDVVVHLAAEALVDASIRDPGTFYLTNVYGGLNLLEAMAVAGVKRMVFSSSAAVYGDAEYVPIPENVYCNPINSYGESKLVFERMLEWYHIAYGLNYISLRYFNVCGATERYGEFHEPETHLIPSLFEVGLGHRPAIHLYGTDYDTPDGTCIRDYIHVLDVATAHLVAISDVDRLQNKIYNIGCGVGYSNMEVINVVQKITKRIISIDLDERRIGDPVRLIANIDRIHQELGWKPHYSDLTNIIETAWKWRIKNPEGYIK